MGSTWTKSPDNLNKKNIFGQKESVPVFLQFVPGVCVRNITSMFHEGYGGEEYKIRKKFRFRFTL